MLPPSHGGSEGRTSASCATGNCVQSKADGSILAVKPTILEQVWAGGLPFGSDIRLTLLKGVLALKLPVPVPSHVSPKR